MQGNEWSLLVFSLLVQMGVGTFVVIEVLRAAYSRRLDFHALRPLHFLSGPAVLLVMLFGMVVSFFHLENPVKALYALNNLKTSWLSREILFLILFILFVAALFLIRRRETFGRRIAGFLTVLSGLAGLFLIFAMSRLYMLETVPVWNRGATPVAFFTTTFLLGSLAASAGLSFQLDLFKKNGSTIQKLSTCWRKSTFRRLSLFSLALIGVQIAGVFFFKGMGAREAGESISMVGFNQERAGMELLRVILACFGAALLVVLILRLRKEEEERLGIPFFCLAFCVILVSEILGRYLFYASFDRVGI